MKIILSRKGFDSANGGCPSPILPDGTLLSLPIPASSGIGYDSLRWGEKTYSQLLAQLRPGKEFPFCHLDPDIREGVRSRSVPGWKPAFGQVGAPQGLLANAGVAPGDLFLFFGWFRQTEEKDGQLSYVGKRREDPSRGRDKHVVFGYLQIGEILTDPAGITAYSWHPHGDEAHLRDGTNALYLPRERLSFLPERKGYGVLDYREDRVLTLEGQNRGTWKALDFLMPEHVYGKRKNSAGGPGLYYGGLWQELVVFESPGLLDWAKGLLE